MQWLIDIIVEKVIAEIGIPPVYIDRGDLVAWDFTLFDLTDDFVFHELDLSAFVPAGAKAVLCRVYIKNTGIGQELMLRKHGNVGFQALTVLATQVANIQIEGEMTCAVSEDRKIEYLLYAGGWLDVNICILGWWL